jgi:fumarate reductase subunit D
MSERVEARKRPALTHLFWWFMFAQGGGVAALFLPAHILVQGIIGPLGGAPVVDRHYDTWINALGNPIIKVYLLVIISLPFFHFAHRLRYLVVDFGIEGAKGVWAQVGFYGMAVALTIVTAWLLLTIAPINFRIFIPAG